VALLYFTGDGGEALRSIINKKKKKEGITNFQSCHIALAPPTFLLLLLLLDYIDIVSCQ